MKLVSSTIAVLLLCVSTSSAQILKSYGMKVGAVEAIRTFEYTGNISLPTDNRWGLDVGIFAELFNTPHFTMLTELHYIQKGYSSTELVTTAASPDGDGTYSTLRPRSDFLSFPIMGKLRFGSDEFEGYGLIGPRLDFLLNASELDYSSPQFGGTLGVGIQFKVSSSPQFLIEGRYSPNFGNAFESQNLAVKNRSFEFLIGAGF